MPKSEYDNVIGEIQFKIKDDTIFTNLQSNFNAGATDVLEDISASKLKKLFKNYPDRTLIVTVQELYKYKPKMKIVTDFLSGTSMAFNQHLFGYGTIRIKQLLGSMYLVMDKESEEIVNKFVEEQTRLMKVNSCQRKLIEIIEE